MRKLIGLCFALATSIFSVGSMADPHVRAIGDAFIANLPAGWKAEVGSWVYFDSVGCFTTPGFTCYGDNPSSPYGSPYFGEYGATPNLATLQLDEDEAVVIIFRTPPRMRYFSFNQYLYKRADSNTEIFGSLSGALNLRQLGTTASPEPGAQPFDSYAAVVWTADQNTFHCVETDLLESGVPLQAINDLPLPQTIPARPPEPEYDLRMGHGTSSDIFNLLMRTALPEDQAEFEGYVRENPYYVLRVSPGDHLAPAQAPAVGYPSDVSGVAENSKLQAALNHLVRDIRNNYEGTFSLTEQTSTYTTHTGWDCISEASTCSGDNYDSLYSHEMKTLVRVNNLQDFVLVVGVNHQETGKATYVNFAVYDSRKLASIVSVTDTDLTLKSALYHAGITDPDDPRVGMYKGLYAYIFSYDCAGRRYCVAIPPPTASDPVGLQPGAPFFVLGRSYMEPHTLVRPLDTEIVHHRVFVGTRK